MPIETASNSTSPGTAVLCVVLFCAAAILVGCSTPSRYSQSRDSAPGRPADLSSIPDAVPRNEPMSRYGNPDSYKVFGKRYYTLASNKGYVERGIASWYGTKFHGHRTSSGEPYDMYRMSAAHKTLPLPTYARITNLDNGKSVIVKINDRGPFHGNRLIDLSYAAAARLDILKQGTGLVEVRTIDPGQPAPEQPQPLLQASKPKISPRPQADQPPSLYLQLGAFLSRSNAERLQARLTDAELPGELRISEAYSNQKRIYRVRIGPLQTVESADQLVQVLTRQGIQSPRIVID